MTSAEQKLHHSSLFSFSSFLALYALQVAKGLAHDLEAPMSCRSFTPSWHVKLTRRSLIPLFEATYVPALLCWACLSFAWLWQCSGVLHVSYTMQKLHPIQACSLQGCQDVNLDILAVKDLGTGSGWQQSKQNWALHAVEGHWS